MNKLTAAEKKQMGKVFGAFFALAEQPAPETWATRWSRSYKEAVAGGMSHEEAIEWANLEQGAMR